MRIKREIHKRAFRKRKSGYRNGVSLVEVMTTILVLSITFLGSTIYRYNSALDEQKANEYITAARIANLLCENWRSSSDATAYDPTIVDFGTNFTIHTNEISNFDSQEFTLLGTYRCVLNGKNFYTTMSWKDVDAKLKVLKVVTHYKQNDSQSSSIGDVDKSFELTTYKLAGEY